MENRQEFPMQFISASTEYADFDRQVPAPYIRKKFALDRMPEEAELLITGLGFYRVFINGKEITKCALAPYISNPDDIIYYDAYDVLPWLETGGNVIGIILGNGMCNAFGGFIWDFHKARWRGAPMTALRLDLVYGDGNIFSIESDESFLAHPSPLLEDDIRSGEIYDARLEIPDWCSPSLWEEGWHAVVKRTPPRGEPRLCTASPVKVWEIRRAVSITPCAEGYLYDFGVDTAGICELTVRGRPGQEIRISYGEWIHDGVLDRKNLMFPESDSPYKERVQDTCYICRGEGEESWKPFFSYYGFRYAYVRGIDKEQADENLLAYHVLGGDFQEMADFSSSDATADRLWEMTRRATLSNFLWFPTDCPHREKNGWTGDAALSAEHMLLNLSVEDSLREWLRNVMAAQRKDGSLPGIVPTGEWGDGCGPAWDQVIVEIPYCLYRLRGDLDTAREAAPSVFRYLFCLSGLRNDRGLVDTGLGDWCETGKSGGGQKAPVEVTSTAVGVHLLEEAKVLFRALGREAEYQYADRLRRELKKAFRRYLIDFSTMTVAGSCQASQAMAICYGLFRKSERRAAFSRLLEIIRQNGGYMNGGALGLRVLFHVLTDCGEADLAYEMITRPDYPSYGNWIARGATSLWEDFLVPEADIHSRNHHFFGDISGWFLQAVAGIVPNPYLEDPDSILVSPHFIRKLRHAGGAFRTPSGKIALRWERDGQNQKKNEIISMNIRISGNLSGRICLPVGWEFEDGFCEKELKEGNYICRNTMPA
ncbi:MAG: family 78 glycoside hydrolase catalytic domain [Lachnospiraceae bacterium]|nr:family 78 glycoside hydrolase catalytic domain [uncultured Acetatifactor sp.]MCI8542938.1 family 78 glycoside hydrolase catalytic domain [Lachnospiraceae bacterium]